MALVSPSSFAIEVELEAALSLTTDANCAASADGDGFQVLRTAAFTGTADAGCYSNLSIPSGKNGWVDAQVRTTGPYNDATQQSLGQYWIVGLNANPTSSSGYTDIDYAVYANAAGVYTIFESGVQKAAGYSMTDGDRVRVALDGGTVRYYINGTLLYTSLASPTYPLYLDGTVISGSMRNVRMCVWTDISADVLFDPGVTTEQGIRGASPTDLVASPGIMRYRLRNTTASSGGVLGCYSPGHASVRSNWGLGRRSRMRIGYGGTTRTVFTGLIDSIEPIQERHNESVEVAVTDWMDELTRRRLNVATQVGKRADEVLRAIVLSMPRQPDAMNFDVANSTFEYSLDGAISQQQTALTEVQRVEQSEYGTVYVTGDGTLRSTRRTARLQPSTVASFTNDMLQFRLRYERTAVINRVKATTHPRRVDGSTDTILYSLQGTPSVPAGGSIDLAVYYSDPNTRAARVGGVEMQTPVANTDYKMNTSEDGGGTDLTSSFTVTPNYGANGANPHIANGSASLGYVTLEQGRGRGLYDYDPVDTIIEDTDSIAEFGENELALDLPYQSAPLVASAIAEYIVNTWGVAEGVEGEMEFMGNTSATFMGYALDTDVGEAAGITETATGINDAYWIQSRRLSVTARGKRVDVTWGLAKAKLENFWQLDSASFSQLGTTTVLGPL